MDVFLPLTVSFISVMGCGCILVGFMAAFSRAEAEREIAALDREI